MTTSSYGQPMPRHFGRMRVAGTVIWATDLKESSTTQGGKGRPKTTTYSYSASFAVALSSTPVARIGRIWADGNLLRGANDDLKVEGAMRFYTGFGDAAVDPVIAADKGMDAPAFRDCAYAVFEDLQLADFGNRIPALTFEIFSQEQGSVSLNQLVPQALGNEAKTILSGARGFSDEGGAVGSTLSAIDRVFPLACITRPDGLQLASSIQTTDDAITLPEQLSETGSDDANAFHRKRVEKAANQPLALRYYDEDRDYQPSVQRALGGRTNGREVMIDLPAAMRAQGAKDLANQNAHRARWRQEVLVWRIGELNPALSVGRLVKVPGHAGLWRVISWEWYDRGIELGLERIAPGSAASVGATSGSGNAPDDVEPGETHLVAFEAPADGFTDLETPALFAAASSGSAGWKGAALFVAQGTALAPIGTTGQRRALSGYLASSLPPSNPLVFNALASIEIDLIPDDLGFTSTDFAGLASGANRLLLNNEVVQFLSAEKLNSGNWLLSGLLRGRAGTEQSAQKTHPSGSMVVSLDDRLTALDQVAVASDPATQIAAIGRGDEQAVIATLSNTGLSRRPPVPVHPSTHVDSTGDAIFCWTRRARGQWRWPQEGDVPLVEEQEQYLLGYGPVDRPLVAWTVTEPRFVLTKADRTSVVSEHGPGRLWVKQVGTYHNSHALLLGEFN
ncbi:MAG: phage tail protein [Pseudomonadota bacterium]|nr:phage tail protein [Pseudomonadota bacterium]